MQALPSTLPQITRDRLQSITSLSVMLASWLRETLIPSPGHSWKRRTRREEIEIFLSQNLTNAPRLGDLADHMGLSSTRTGHLVREVTGDSFIALRDRMRLERAKLLLVSTLFKATEIAVECGFSTPQNFHRFFRSQTKMAPLTYRRKFSAPA